MCQYWPMRGALDGRHRGREAHAGAAAREVLAWPRRANPAGCYCDPASREHKWGLVLETIHYALARRKNGQERKIATYWTRSVRPLLGDGAMGTQLMLAGLEQGNCGEAWNLTHPEKVLAIQRRYAEAGSDCILTNTFGGSRIMLNRHSQATTPRDQLGRRCGLRGKRSARGRAS